MSKKMCCACSGGTPSYRCRCTCHKQEDCEYWEVLAFIWIYDAPDEAARQDQWKRFCMAYPEFARESCESFWERIRQTHWYHKHKHHYPHHHHEYGDDSDE